MIKFQPTVNMYIWMMGRLKELRAVGVNIAPLGNIQRPLFSVPAPPRRCMQRMGNFKYETQLFVRSRSSLNRAFDAEILQKFSQKQLYAEQTHPGYIAYALWNQNF